MYNKKMLVILMLAMALCVSKVYAQWSWQNPKPQGNTLNSIKYVSPTTAYAVGNLGVIMKTTNGGADWEFQNSGVTADLKSVTFVNPEVGWATGSLGGKVLRTIDGGATWQKMNATYYDLNSIFFINQNLGWAVGTAGLIIKTTNGGQTWSPKQQFQGYHLNSVFFVNPELGWTVSDRGNILKSVDGGETWNPQISGNTYYQYEVYFIDEANGWIATDNGTIMRTTNGGNQWTQGAQLGGSFLSLQFVNSSVGYVVGVHGQNGKIHKTIDGGVSWTQQTSGSSKSLNSINFFEQSNEGLIVGEAGTTLKTTNGGNTWTSLSSGEGAFLHSVFFVDHNTGWLAGQNNDVRKTTDGGKNWIAQNAPGGLWHYSVFFINQNIGWISGSYGKIFKTTDGGTNWVAQSSGITDQYLLSIRFVDENVGWAVGTNGKIIKTTNGGTTWTAQTSGTTEGLNSAAFDNQNTGWVAGQNGLILKTTDGGTSWVTQTSGITSTLISIDFINSTTGWAVGSSDKILKTTDAGTTWTAQTSGITYGLNSVHFIDIDIGWATGGLGKILKTTNGGTTWTTESSYTVNDLLGTFFVDEFTGWAVGIDGIVLKHQITPLISLSVPNGGESWNVGSNRSITWASNFARKLDISYSTNAGSSWVNIISGTPASNGSYAWTVPNSVSTNCKVKINTSGVPRFIDTSDNVFTIYQPEIVLANPNGGENWKIGSVDTIKWTNSYVNHVKIKYTTNNGADWISVTDSASATDGRFPWTIPNTPSSNCKIQIIDLSSAIVGDTSASTFTISTTQFTLSSPNGGENWQVGSQQNITWNSSLVMNSSVAKKDIKEIEAVNVKLEYSTDNGLNWADIIANTPNSGSFSWLIPNTPSTNCIVKISQVGYPLLNDSSNNSFTIFTPTITLLKPNGGENWRAGSLDTIKWTSSNVSNVKLEYTTDNGSTWANIIANISASSGNHLWVLPYVNSSNCKVKISQVGYPQFADSSDSVFTIYSPKATVIKPNGGENFKVGDTDTIKWTSSNMSAVRLEYSTDSGSNWSTIQASIAADSGAYLWTIPNTTSTNCKVRIYQDIYPEFGDTSDNVFTIYYPYVSVTKPNGGENLKVGDIDTIKWSSGNVANVNIQYSTDAGANWISVIDSISSALENYLWTIPNTPSAQCKIRVMDLGNTQIGDTSNNVFEISKTLFTLTSPNGGESWRVGNEKTINWNAAFLMKNLSKKDGDENQKTIGEPEAINVKLELTTDNGTSWSVLSESSPNIGSYNLVIPNTPSQNCKVRISQIGYPLHNDLSDSVFTIFQPTITVDRPNGNENYKVGDIDTIKWTSAYLNYVRIEYTTDNGTSWNEIDASVAANPGSLPWVVPNTPSVQCKVRISEVYNSSLADSSNNVFTISQSQYALTSPNGGEEWQANSQKNITWNSALSMQNLTIKKGEEITDEPEVVNLHLEFTSDNGYSWVTINNSVPDTGSYTWTVVNFPSQDCKIKISQVGYPDFFDISDSVFTIYVPSLSITKPNGGENFRVGEVDTIKWMSNYVAAVKLEYSTNYGLDWTLITATTPANIGSYLWTIPDTPSTQCKVRVSDVDDPTLKSISYSIFTIFATQISLTSPNGGEIWQSGTHHNITWNSLLAMKNLKDKNGDESVLNSGTLEAINVKLEYTTNNGSDWIVIVPSTANSGTYDWTVPYSPSTNCLVKVSQVGYPQYFDVSYGLFTIFNPTVTVVKPNGGENWRVGETDTIKWVSEHVTNVKIEITTNNGTNWNTITDSIAAVAGSYVWTISNTPSTNCKVRITDASNSSIEDMSDNVFTISPIQFTVVSPNGGESWRIGTLQSITWNSLLISEAMLNKSKDGEVVSNEPEAINVKLEYSTNNGSNWIEISASTANSGSYNWTVPNTPSEDCRVKVSQVGFQQIGDSSNNVFTIFNPSVTVVKPNGGENWKVGDSDTIKWTSSFVANVKIEATSDNGATWTLLAASTPAAPGMQVVPIPNTPSTQCKVRITDAGDSTVTDMSDAVFTISQTQFTLSSPNGGENWLAGTQHSITWNSSLAMKSVINQKGDETHSTGGNTEAINVKLEYSTDNGSIWIEISGSTANSGTYNWTVPNTPSANCRVKVSQVGFQQFSDSSNNVFTIFTPAITVTKPNGGEVWRATDTDTIKWTSNDVANVKIQYSTDNGTNWSTVATSTPASAGNYVWSIPNTPSTQCKVRITSSNNSAIGDVSDSLFVITPFVSARENGSEIPTEFSLEQNFPNPFNPSTIIQYAIASRGKQFVSLKIYDVLGKEVAVLVNEEQEPGIYKVEFSTGSLGIGSGLQSGTYFYELRTNEFRLVKKLMVVK